MFRRVLLASAAIAIATSAQPALAAPANAAASAALPASNPFAKPSTLPFQAPDYAKIKDSDYLPAIMAGMAEHKSEVTAIANQAAAPTFDNTLGALERSGELLERAILAFSAVNGADTNDTLQATETKTSPLLSQHRDFLYLN
ncbi:MAG TPA: dipeptidyl carboxypeptidase II, partial [Sphingomicrobium sp.]|nr:dipeptidyl carboxypeptidase II [Sphingomicrobium sp.]